MVEDVRVSNRIVSSFLFTALLLKRAYYDQGGGGYFLLIDLGFVAGCWSAPDHREERRSKHFGCSGGFRALADHDLP